MAWSDWIDVPLTDVDGDSDIAQSVLDALRKNDRALRFQLLQFTVTEATRANAAYGLMATLDPVLIPDFADYSGLQRSIDLEVEVKVTAGTGTIQLRDDTAGTTGTEPTTVSASYEPKRTVLNIASGLKNTERTWKLYGKCSGGGTLYVRILGPVAAILQY